MENSKYTETQLYDFVLTESTITCDLCKKTNTIDADTDEAIDY